MFGHLMHAMDDSMTEDDTFRLLCRIPFIEMDRKVTTMWLEAGSSEEYQLLLPGLLHKYNWTEGEYYHTNRKRFEYDRG